MADKNQRQKELEDKIFNFLLSIQPLKRTDPKLYSVLFNQLRRVLTKNPIEKEYNHGNKHN